MPSFAKLADHLPTAAIRQLSSMSAFFYQCTNDFLESCVIILTGLKRNLTFSIGCGVNGLYNPLPLHPRPVDLTHPVSLAVGC